ncbi:MAG: radical SAM protein, partial [bacterium]|nr:radical SAM protein [bacterium]
MIENTLFDLIQMAMGDTPFDQKTIEQSLESPNELVLLHALDVLRNRYCYDLSGRLLELLFHPLPGVRSKALDTIRIDPFFAFERRESFFGALHAGDGKETDLENLFSETRKDQLLSHLRAVPDSAFCNGLEELALLPGVDNLGREAVFKGPRQVHLERFEELRSRYIRGKYTPQVAIAPSYACNLDCFYCYSRELNSHYAGDMTPAQFETLLDTVTTGSPVDRVGIVGGEPSVFPDLQCFIDILKKRNMGFYFATNGIAAPDIFAGIVGNANLLTVTLHVEKDGFYSSSQMDNLLANVKLLGEKSISTVVRYNMLEVENRDWRFLEKYIDALPDLKFGFAVVFPSQSAGVNHVGMAKLMDFSKKIIALLTFLKEKAGAKDFKAVFSKPFPPCAFSPEELEFVLRHTQYKNVCEIDRNGYTNNVCVNPDLSWFPCMALTHERYGGEKILPYEELKKE